MTEMTCSAPTVRTATAGDILYSGEQVLRREDLVAYANASGDQNPIHQDEEFAKDVGLPDVIAHGMLTFGLVASALEQVSGGAENVLDLTTRFAAPVVVPQGEQGVTVAITVTLKSRDEDARKAQLDATVTVAGTKVLNRTRATISLS